MKAKDLILRVVNEVEKGKFEIKEFKPYMNYENFIGTILADAEILRPTGLKDRQGREIYEGDYLGIELDYEEFAHPMCVQWSETKHNWSLCIEGCYEYDLDEFDDYLIIGNEYQGITY